MTFLHTSTQIGRMINGRLYLITLGNDTTLQTLAKYADTSDENFRKLSTYIKEVQRL